MATSPDYVTCRKCNYTFRATNRKHCPDCKTIIPSDKADEATEADAMEFDGWVQKILDAVEQCDERPTYNRIKSIAKKKGLDALDFEFVWKDARFEEKLRILQNRRAVLDSIQIEHKYRRLLDKQIDDAMGGDGKGPSDPAISRLRKDFGFDSTATNTFANSEREAETMTEEELEIAATHA